MNGASPGSTPRNYNAAATVIQKTWKGHSATRESESKIQELKQEVRELRSEEHIKYLTKELNTAKSALEQERKLRALQMDAIKVLWKEVQMMDATKGGKEADKPRPSGSHGSKISSRSSEHSIAKLMETLEATAVSSKADTLPEVTEGFEAGEGSCSTRATNASTSDAAVEKLGATCAALQTQVEQLQTSLGGVIKFMSAFNPHHERVRHHSSSADPSDGAETVTAGPASLPPSMFASMAASATFDPNQTPVQQGQDNQFSSLPPSVWQVPAQVFSH